jgi:hypothetical protein
VEQPPEEPADLPEAADQEPAAPEAEVEGGR